MSAGKRFRKKLPRLSFETNALGCVGPCVRHCSGTSRPHERPGPAQGPHSSLV
jgi:hypothetical protein